MVLHPRGLAQLTCGLMLWAHMSASAQSLPAGNGAGPETALVEEFLATTRGQLTDPSRLESLRSAARVLIKRLETRAVEVATQPSQRVEITKRARQALVDGLVKELPGEPGARAAAAESFLERAAKEHRDGRTDYLERSMICWCPNENWTKTLAGCPDGCADEQKFLLRQWLDEGATDEEIIARMVAYPGKGDVRVRALPTAEGVNWIGYLFPGFLGLGGLVVVASLLLSLTKKKPAGAPGSSGDGESSAQRRRLDSDAEIGERIERELEEMDRP